MKTVAHNGLIAVTLGIGLVSSAFGATTTLLTESFDGTDGTLPAFWEADNNDGTMVSRIDNNELEQKVDSTPGTARTVAAYINDDDTDRGAWRDVNVNTTLRYNEPVPNGLVIRGQESSAAGIDGGDFYHARMNDSTLQLYRVINGSLTLVDSHVGGSLGTVDRELRVQIANIANPDQDHVRIQVQLMSADGLSVVRSIDFTDTSSFAITRAGTVGIRSTTGSTGRATFDDLSVASLSSSLLWYDDYYDNTAPRMAAATLGVTTTVVVEKYQFTSIGNGNAANASVDFDAFTATPQWENVNVSALMRWNTGFSNSGRLEAGITARETGVTTAFDGDYYFFALIRNEDANASAARIFRVENGVETLIADQFFAGLSTFAESVNLFLNLEVITTDTGVELTAIASLNQDLSAPLVTLSFTDSLANAILGSGSAGFRVEGAGTVNGTVNYDNFTVMNIPSPAALPAGLALMALTFTRGRRQ